MRAVWMRGVQGRVTRWRPAGGGGSSAASPSKTVEGVQEGRAGGHTWEEQLQLRLDNLALILPGGPNVAEEGIVSEPPHELHIGLLHRAREAQRPHGASHRQAKHEHAKRHEQHHKSQKDHDHCDCVS